MSFDCLVKVISKHKDMCTSAPMLNFLGFSILADKDYFKVSDVSLLSSLPPFPPSPPLPLSLSTVISGPVVLFFHGMCR